MKFNKEKFLEYTLNTQVTWIKSADTKASILLAVIAAFFTLFNYLDLFNPESYINNIYLLIFMLITVVLLIGSALFFLFTIMPSLRLTKANDNSYLYFGSIRVMKNFQSKLKYNLDKNCNPSYDLLNQIKIDAIIADKKMKKLKIGTWLIDIGIVFSVILFIIKFFAYK